MESSLLSPHTYTGGKRKKITFFTSSEYGQANVILAVVYELLLLQAYEIDIASFAPLKNRIQDINALVSNNSSPARFHTVTGLSALEALTAKKEFIGPYRPGIRGASDTYRVTLPAIATTWDENDYMTGLESCINILRSISSDLIVVDPLMSQGLEACKALSRNYVVLSPNTFQEICKKQQPLFTQLCRWPAVSSAFRYPVPWYLIPANIYLKFLLLWILITSPKVKGLINWRQSRGLPKLPPVFNIWEKENKYLVVSVPETEYPCYVPPNVIPCGPILLPVRPVSEHDPKLQAWLEGAPTIMINLGSHIRMDDQMAQQFASGLKIVLHQMPGIQILWKLKTSGGLAVSSDAKTTSGFSGTGIKKESLEAIEPWILSGSVKVLEWLSVDPMAVLQSGNIVCSVHHGGSNSFHEALSAGVPQVILPCWLDTLDFANRVEWLGIGVYGSRNAAPSVEADELSQALLKALGNDHEATRMREKAKELAMISARPGGRRKACEEIIGILLSSSEAV
ncbi:UDP-Glycosyltransferase/glycogen phosphorylase [Mollisia scopiformis]|uniref:UDP-Glycosyltransferase/glycogen phosphorylase n=1 Tax=Mollisia scopiformis TaxID=149040 RepID=A0A194WWG6_MOLSC|nr:UDP-Glycosyltransferase/glycogen phosphorylase [Mollisia scopiformis]KUJ12323.1 UDP-Glycosyltransferase/glycogen phosphorylase [Mollisia scopiformis]